MYKATLILQTLDVHTPKGNRKGRLKVRGFGLISVITSLFFRIIVFLLFINRRKTIISV